MINDLLKVAVRPMLGRDAPARLQQQPVRGPGRTARKEVAVMVGEGNGAKRDWHRDNNAEGGFEDELDRFFSRDEVLSALEEANRGKRGPRFRTPDMVVSWGMDQVVGRRLGYRTVAARISGRMRSLGFDGISSSQFFKRARRVAAPDRIGDPEDPRVLGYGAGAEPRPVKVTVAVDSTGLSPDRPAGWMTVKWDGSRARGWYKLHALADVDTGSILSYVVTLCNYNDSLAFERLIGLAEDAGHDIGEVLADAAYDRRSRWTEMESKGIRFVANIRGSVETQGRNSSSGRARGCMARAGHVRRILEVGRERWREEVGYSRRWRIEGVFSDMKRMFGDVIRARKRENVAGIVARMVQCHNRFKAVRMGLSRN